jgi:hypothetical protein
VRPIAAAADRGDTEVVDHPELLAPIATLLAIEIAHLRWVLWTQWRCRKCHVAHIECECKPGWVKILL